MAVITFCAYTSRDPFRNSRPSVSVSILLLLSAMTMQPMHLPTSVAEGCAVTVITYNQLHIL